MRVNDIPKFVINLKRRPDRLESIKRELDYVGWDYEVFDGIDTNSYMGCTLSHLKIFEICKDRGYKKVIIIEDDTFFMPYFIDLIEKIEPYLEDIDLFNFGPTIHRPITGDSENVFLLDLTTLPVKETEDQRGIYTTNCVMYDMKLFDEINKISEIKFNDETYFHAIDDFIYQFIMPNFKSYCPILPLTTQGVFFSDISGDYYNNFYTLTYNWSLYTPYKIPNEFKDFNNIQEIKKNKIHLTIDYHNER